MKYLTFSFDDGITQDKRMIELLNKYGLKCTFNLNSSLLGLKGGWEQNGKWLSHNKISPLEIKEIYARDGHNAPIFQRTSLLVVYAKSRLFPSSKGNSNVISELDIP